MFHFPTVWVENSPDSLLDITLKFCITHENILYKYDEEKDQLVLHDDLSLPVGICERMLNICKTEDAGEGFNKCANYFSDTTRTHLRYLDLSNSLIEDESLEILSNHSIVELNISNCKKLTIDCLPNIAKLNNSLVSLTVGDASHIFDFEDTTDLPEVTNLPENGDQIFSVFVDTTLLPPSPEGEGALYSIEVGSNALELCLGFNPPQLRKLVINGLKTTKDNYFAKSFKYNKCLTYLDLSNCGVGYKDFVCLATHSKQLTSLILCDVEEVVQYVPVICQLKSLRHLDISHSGESPVRYISPNKTLKYIVENLENLVSLDISGTNLAGGRTRERESPDTELAFDGKNSTDIPGLASRVNRPLEFLGLFNTAHDACFRHDIPAKMITGDANEEQILNAGQVYCAREHMIQKALNDLFQIFRYSTCQNTRLALDVIMEAMQLHPSVKPIQVSASASLFYIVKGDDKDRFNVKIRRKIIKALLDAMSFHFSDETLLRNACLTLIHFKIPEDVFFDYERLVNLLLIIVAPSERQEEFVQRIGLYLLNSLACQVDGFNKKLVGDRGAITIMVQLIQQRLLNNLCDEVMETAWSTMWNVTDETPINCARFLESKGLDLFLGCLRAFPEKAELLRNMMGLLGNVAEVKELRYHLMKDEYLSVFSDLLGSKCDGIEVSYNSAGILSHIASDGEETWAKHNISSVKRKDVLAKMVDAIEKWDLDTKRNINYRSFEPILRLLNVEHTPEVQHWAVWALANLTKVYPEKYCSLLREEGGIHMLNKLLLNTSYPRILELAQTIIKQCERFESGDSDCDSDISLIEE